MHLQFVSGSHIPQKQSIQSFCGWSFLQSQVHSWQYQKILFHSGMNSVGKQHGNQFVRQTVFSSISLVLSIWLTRWLRPLQNPTFCPISVPPVSGISALLRQAQISTLHRRINPQNTQCIPACLVGSEDRTGVVKIIVGNGSYLPA